ncbi:MAG: ferrochelatase [Gemmatimonadota bacterium]
MREPPNDAAILVLNFGEPQAASPEEVIPFLERIFLANSTLEPHETEEDRACRNRQLAERRAPGLIEEYEEIGGSPLNGQADTQAEALRVELATRGHPIPVYSAFQFTPPFVEAAVQQARADGVRHLIGLPIYPLCGHSTNVAALNDVQAAIDRLGWTGVGFEGITGWHRHPRYLEMRADAIRSMADAAELNLNAEGTRLVFSAHGTPVKYLEAGSGYRDYVLEYCAEVVRILGVERYELGFQNHSNRGVEWTQPDVEKVIEEVEADVVVVDPMSFMHEQSETLAELDHELREEAEARGLEFHRVPVPHDDERFSSILADLVEPLLTGKESPVGLRYGPCRCRPRSGTFCLNSLPREEAAPLPEPLRRG